MGLVSAVSVAALAHLAERQGPERPIEPVPPPRPPVTLTAPAAAWERMPGVASLYALDAPALAGLSAASEARRHARGAREDTLTFGALAQDGAPHLHLVLTRSTGESGPARSLFVDLVRRTAEVGVAVSRAGQPVSAMTKLGPVEVASLSLAAGGERACLGFRGQHGDIGLRLLGWYCAAAGAAAGPEVLVCLLDRLTLGSGTADAALKVTFAQAEHRRVCGGSRVEARVRS